MRCSAYLLGTATSSSVPEVLPLLQGDKENNN
jgi:hypothetical protein